MPRRDGKDRFYKTLKLDIETRKLIKFFREIKQQMLNESENKERNEDDKIT